MGHETGVDLALLLEVAQGVPALVGRELVNPLLAAGPRTRLHPMPAAPQR